ncbi:hypothetical protein IQ07DRAFT_681693 [Pyrenochaeta sp. DS3sAY3a]|nr:hypothetical protein IQ07DRAFT_681693 [Pyrenochaeta sp. DS3sAY3a]
MADYSKQTVAQLRQLLKDRGIPSTGLQRKAQIIEKLQEDDEADAKAEAEAEVEAEVEAEEADAPLDPVEQVDGATGEEGVTPAKSDESHEPPTKDIEPAPASEPALEAVAHVDGDAAQLDTQKAIETAAEDTTVEEEPGAPLDALPAEPEEVVGPRITEPVDEETRNGDDVKAADDDTQNGEEVKVTDEELPDAPAPATEPLSYAKGSKEELKQGEALSREDNTASPAPNEKQSIEKPELLPIPERSTAETSRLNTEELEADTRKRKRRSNTPELPTQDIRAKKHRISQESAAPEVHLKEDEDVVMEQSKPEDIVDSPAVESDVKREKKEKTALYKDLVQPSTADTHVDAFEDDRPTVPALHPVTSALYIRNFMRPLRPEPLRAHLIALATPASGSSDPSVVESLFLDAMRTHALVLLCSTTVASRVRASLHGTVWPPEANRKELWADFIPSEHIGAWIAEEEDALHAEKAARAAGRPQPAKRFEVVYHESANGTITADFRELGSSAPANAPRGPRQRTDIDTRRPSTQNLPPHTAATGAGPSRNVRQNIEASFKTLDDLFRSTKAKPHIYYLPTSDDIAAQRLEDLDADTSRDWAAGETRKGRGIKSEPKFKYSFDGGGRAVEVGEDRGPWSEVFRGRGGYRGRGGGYRGGYRGRGGGGGGGDGHWRG